MSESKHERALSEALRMYGRDLAPHTREVTIMRDRRLRWDFCWEGAKVLAEIQGGTFSKKRTAHSGASLVRDFEKNNLAVIAGWRVLYFTARDMTARTLPATVETIRRATARLADPYGGANA